MPRRGRPAAAFDKCPGPKCLMQAPCLAVGLVRPPCAQGEIHPLCSPGCFLASGGLKHVVFGPAPRLLWPWLLLQPTTAQAGVGITGRDNTHNKIC